MTKVTIANAQIQGRFTPGTKHRQPHISGVTNMLTIKDVHQIKELSSSELGTVAGAISRGQAAGVLMAASDIFASMNLTDAAGSSAAMAHILANYGYIP